MIDQKELIKLNLGAFGNLFRSDPSKLNNQELLALDFNLHRSWSFKRQGHRIHFGDDTWDFEDLLTLHVKVREEMEKRSFKHTLKDELDDKTLLLKKSQEPKNDFEEYQNIVFNEEDAVKFYRGRNRDE